MVTRKECPPEPIKQPGEHPQLGLDEDPQLPIFWQEREDSNPRPPVLETGALPTELRSWVVPLELSLSIATKLKISR